MQLGMIGLVRMGASMVRCLMKKRHDCGSCRSKPALIA